MKKLTPRQSEILQYIRQTIARNGYPPTRADIVKAFGFRSPTAAEDHLRALAKKGSIELLAGTSRGIRLLDEPDVSHGLPVVGRVAAGAPILAQQNIERTCEVDASLFSPTAHYLLTVSGMSMRDVGIVDGDLLAVHRTPEARENQIVVARIDDEVTVKRFQRHGDQVRLLAENPDYEPIVVDLKQQQLTIEGLAVGVLRLL